MWVHKYFHETNFWKFKSLSDHVELDIFPTYIYAFLDASEV